MLGTNVTPAQLLQARSPSLDLDSLYGAGPQDPESAKFYEADGLHLKMGKTVGPAKRRLRPAARRGQHGREEAQGDHPRPAQRREPRGRADAPGDDPLPQPRGRHAARRRPGRAEVRQGARDRHEALPVDDPHGLPAADRQAGGGERRLQQRAQGVRGRAPRRPTCRRCRSSSRSPASGSGTRWCARAYNWNRLRQRQRRARVLFIFSATGGDLGGDTRLPSTWIADFRRLYDFGDANKPDLTVPPSKFNRAMRIDTRSSTRCSTCRRRPWGFRTTPASTTCGETSRSATSRARGW